MICQEQKKHYRENTKVIMKLQREAHSMPECVCYSKTIKAQVVMCDTRAERK